MSYRPPRPKPRPGSLPLPKDDEPPPRTYIQITDEFNTLPAEVQEQHKARLQSEMLRRWAEDDITALQRARKKAAEMADYVRTDVFDNWVRRGTDFASTPKEWTQATVLYAHYVAYAQRFGRNRGQLAQSVQAMATETAWGRMMATLDAVAKTRRASGWHYSLRCKQLPARRKKGAKAPSK